MTTAERNSKLQIVNLKGYKFKTPMGVALYHSGFALYVEGEGFVRFKSDEPGEPYTPRGGRKVLKEIIAAGGFVNYDTMDFVQAV